MEMPDIEALCARFANATMAERYGILNAVYGSVNTTDVGGPDEITSPHLFGWWKEALFDFLSHTGYVNIQFMDEKIPHPESNLRVEAYKPGGESPPIVDRNKLRSQDSLTYKEIFDDNAYLLMEEEISGKVVVDLGANIGLFTLRCVELGAKTIVAVEAQPTVYNHGLVPNVQGYKNVIPINRAVFDEDGKTVTIDNANVASVVGKPGEEVLTSRLVSIIGNIPEDIFLKIDIEGSEFEVLRSTPPEVLRKAATVVMEIHTSEGKTVQEIHDLMSRAGFEMVYRQEMRGGDNPDESTWVPINVSIEKWRRV